MMKKKFLWMATVMMIAITACVNNNGSDDTMTFTVNGVSFKMIKVEGGTFRMGATEEQGGNAASDEFPVHRVTLSDYYIGETEVTQELWQAVMGSNPSYYCDRNFPVDNVSWDDCQNFVRELNYKTGQHFRLPTEAEWEYAARGGKNSRAYMFSGSNTLDYVAWYRENSGDNPHAVKTLSANELGVYDMSGNMREWCQDKYGCYSGNAQTNPTGPPNGSNRVCRDGSYHCPAWYSRVSRRASFRPSECYANLSFRLAL